MLTPTTNWEAIYSQTIGLLQGLLHANAAQVAPRLLSRVIKVPLLRVKTPGRVTIRYHRELLFLQLTNNRNPLIVKLLLKFLLTHRARIIRDPASARSAEINPLALEEQLGLNLDRTIICIDNMVVPTMKSQSFVPIPMGSIGRMVEENTFINKITGKEFDGSSFVMGKPFFSRVA